MEPLQPFFHRGRSDVSGDPRALPPPGRTGSAEHGGFTLRCSGTIPVAILASLVAERLAAMNVKPDPDYDPGRLEWYWVNRTNGVRTLITPTRAPAVLLYSCATVNGTYTNDMAGVIDTVTKTVTIPRSGGSRF